MFVIVVEGSAMFVITVARSVMFVITAAHSIISAVTFVRYWCIPQKNVTKTDIYWGSYRIRIFVFLTPLQIFAPRL